MEYEKLTKGNSMKWEMDIKTAQENETNMGVVQKNYMLGPLKTSIYPQDNKEFWDGIAKVWGITAAKARNRLCANCEYYNNTESMMEQMNKIPLNDFDKDGGGRGYCHKFDFICHNLRTCKVWDVKEFVCDECKEEKEDEFKSAVGI